MQINSRFTDLYDFTPAVSRTDTVAYNRVFQEASKPTRPDTDEVVTLLVGHTAYKVSIRTYGKPNWFRSNSIYPTPTGRTVGYCSVYKQLVPNLRPSDHLRDYLDAFSKETERTNTTSVDGGLLLTPDLLKVISSTQYSKVVEVPAIDIRNAYDVKEPVVLLVHRYRTTKVFSNISLAASGLIKLVDRITKDPTSIAADIDAYLVSNVEEVPDTRSNKTKVEAKGFDNKISFRHRK